MNSLFGVFAKTWGGSTGTWIVADALLGGFWGAVVGIPVTLALTGWAAHKTKEITG